MTNITMQQGFAALSAEQQRTHREKIGLRAEAILRQFWYDDGTPEAVRALEIEGWMDVLQNCSHSEIRRAWTEYQKSGPRTARGRLYKPDAGALYRAIILARPKPRIVCAAPREDPKRNRVTKEAADAILREAGYRPKRFGSDASG